MRNSIAKAVTAALDGSMSAATKKRIGSKRTQAPVDSTPVAVRSAVGGPTPVAVPSADDGPTPVDVAAIVKQVLLEMQPFIERTIQAAVATAI